MADSTGNENFNVRLEVDGEKIPLKFIIKDILGGAVVGIVKPLKGVGQPKRIVVEVELP